MKINLWKIALIFVSIFILLTTTACETIAAQFRTPSERFRIEGDRLLSEDRTAEAILSYRAAVENDPKNLLALKPLARLYSQQGRRRLALRYLVSAQALAPADQWISETAQSIHSSLPTSPPLPLLWQNTLSEKEPVGLTAGEGQIYISWEDGAVTAVESANGAVAWRSQLPSKATSAPGLGNGMLWVGAQDGLLYNLNPSDGRLTWKFPTKAPIYAPPAFEGAMAYLASGDSTLYAINTADGSLRWSFSTGGPLHSRPVLSDGVMYFGSNDARLYALDAKTGKPFWKDGILTQGSVESAAVIFDGRVYFGSGDSRVYCLAASSGGEYWRYSTPDAVYAEPILSGDLLYIASAGNTLTALGRLTGKRTWEIRAGSALLYPPLLAGGYLFYVAAGDPNLYGVDPQTGAALIQFDTGDWLSSAPILLGNQIILPGKDGTLSAFQLNN